MIFQLEQVNTNLRQIEDIPNTFFQNIEANHNFGYELFPDWFLEAFGNRQDGLYAKANSLFDVIKNSGRENEIVAGYYLSNNVEFNCLNIDSVLFYCENISEELFSAAKDFFHHLYKSLDSAWAREYTGSNINMYIKEFKIKNKVYICPICGNESITSSTYQDRSALDHWLCKAKYPLNSINFDNLLPIGSGCNGASVKGEKEIIWTDNFKIQRQIFFYPFNWVDEIKINLICDLEPNIETNQYGEWRFEFEGINQDHQILVNKWNSFFRINDRWIYQTLHEFIETWTFTFANYLILEIDIVNFDLRYEDALNSFKNVRESFNTNPQNRVEWFFLNYLINEATPELYDGYKKAVSEHIENNT
jgi:hypothetical protein